MNLKTEEKTWAMWCHLASFSALVGVPMGNIVGPLVAWQIKKSESAFVDEHGKEAVNFQISFMLYTLAAIMAFLLGIVFFIGLGAASAANNPGPPGALLPLIIGGGFIGPFLLILFVPLLSIILTIVAALKANNGDHYKYPLTIRFIR